MMISYFVGLDLGQASDYTALAILERTAGALPDEPNFAVRHLHRYPLGTSYPAIVANVVDLLSRPPLVTASPTLAVDGTGVGKAVVDLFRREDLPGDFEPVIITGGDLETYEGDVRRIPKRDLVGVVQVALQTARLKIAPSLADAPTLQRELETFKATVAIAPQDTCEAWREGQHDDLVLAVALALWCGARPEVVPYYAVGPPRARDTFVVV